MLVAGGELLLPALRRARELSGLEEVEGIRHRLRACGAAEHGEQRQRNERRGKAEPPAQEFDPAAGGEPRVQEQQEHRREEEPRGAQRARQSLGHVSLSGVETRERLMYSRALVRLTGRDELA